MILSEIQRSIPPVLLLIFNRPDTTTKVMDVLRMYKTNVSLYCCGWPTLKQSREHAKTEATREIASTIDWPCQVKHYLEKKILVAAVLSAVLLIGFLNMSKKVLSWKTIVFLILVFSVLHRELLVRYRNDKRVMVISANHFHGANHQPSYSYFFSRYNHCWGWASWRRAWQLYDHNMSHWPVVAGI